MPVILCSFSDHIYGLFNDLAIMPILSSGKSTIVQALFRLLEAEDGSIAIDGIDISKVGLHRLRTRISVVPQVPTLFR